MKCKLLAVAAGVLLGTAAHANIVDQWSSIPAPAPPALKPVTVDPKTTALLMLDFMPANCGKNERCLATLPAMKKLLERARAAKMPVVYTVIANTTAADVLKDVAPLPGEPSVLSGPDKFVRTDLEKILKDKGVNTVITVGTASNGAVLFTADAQRYDQVLIFLSLPATGEG
ncbi:isochorismatase family protein [Pseudolabrys taiwanensis]|nr:isochorismatase family protein [Pseudolabrys taiwanensis]